MDEEYKQVLGLYNNQPDKLEFIADQLLEYVRERQVSNPLDTTFQFSRRITERIVERYGIKNHFLKEGAAIGVYKGLERFLLGILKK